MSLSKEPLSGKGARGGDEILFFDTMNCSDLPERFNSIFPKGKDLKGKYLQGCGERTEQLDKSESFQRDSRGTMG